MSYPTGNTPTLYLSLGQSYINCRKALLQSLQSNDYALARTDDYAFARTDQWRWRGSSGLLAAKPIKQGPAES